MPRTLRVLGAGYDPRRGTFLTIEQSGPTTEPLARVYLNPSEVLRTVRALLAALQQVEENRTVTDRQVS